VADDPLSRARKALAAPKGNAVVPARQSGRELIERARSASQRPSPVAPVVESAPVETKSAANLPLLVERVKAAAEKPVPVRPKPAEPPKVEAPPLVAEPERGAPLVATPVSPATQVVPVEIALGQTVPVEIMPQNGQAGAQPPINIVVNVQNNEQRGWGPYWPYPYYSHCRAWNCPRARGLPCTGWFCLW
jgi:hypothetical protein